MAQCFKYLTEIWELRIQALLKLQNTPKDIFLSFSSSNCQYEFELSKIFLIFPLFFKKKEKLKVKAIFCISSFCFFQIICKRCDFKEVRKYETQLWKFNFKTS